MPRPACSDNKDNDTDGKFDFPDDLGCESENDETEDSATSPACSDNRDNDGDGKRDYPDDPGCPIPQSDAEDDDCPSGPGCPQCGDGDDNDGNGKQDFPADPGCAAASDSLEFLDNPVACGSTMMVKVLPGTGMDTGVLDGTSTSQLTTPCGGGGGAPAIAYVFHVSEAKVMVASTNLPLTVIDTVLDLRSSMCSDPLSHLACHDDLTTTNKKSTLTRALQPGTYYLIVEGNSTADTGAYALQVNFFPGQGAVCNIDGDCGPGLVCRIPVGSTMKVCSQPVCNDTLDDDGDGKIDYPGDPGCTSPTDATEDDVCATTPTDPACPACGNGLDDDGDGQSDYPNDPSCVAASGINEACAQSEPLAIATTPQTTGTTVGAVNDFTPPPGSYNGHSCSTTTTTTGAPDRAIQLDLPAMSSLSLRLNPASFTSSYSLLGASCTGMPIDCVTGTTGMAVSNLAAGRYYLIVDGFSTGSGTFTLNTSGTIVNGESCESPLAQSGAITCGIGYACKGAVGSRTCTPAECNDGIDNNGAGGIDHPADPGCQSPSDDSETTVCPGPSCPVCSDGIDNDGDTLIDFPADTGCLAAAGPSEGCSETDPIAAITGPTTAGTLVGATDDHNPSCVATNFPDKIFTLEIPTTLQSLVIDTEGSVVDTVLSFMGSTCSEPSIACDDDGGVGAGDSLITRGFVPAGSYTIAVDSDLATLDTFVINIAGVIPPGGSCEGPLFQAGVLTCAPQFGCNGTPGTRKCTAAQCQDGVDNNGDGTVDFPNDPGCASASDNSETTVCPGASCPACGDGLDNDSDGDVDYPDDSGCDAASGGAEGCVDSDPILAISAPTTTGTLVGATNDHQPSCIIPTAIGVDRMFTLDIPALQSLTIDTAGSAVDAVLSFMDDSCQEPSLDCDDDSAGSLDARIIQSFVPAGSYTIAVDARSTTANTFILNVSGVIVPGESCESPLVGAGVLSCSLGFACNGPVGVRTCTVAQCLDGTDNNSDGKVDFPDDPGCDSFSDDAETTVCPGPACPICSDGIDNDGDGAIDYPADPSCLTASATNEACNQSEPLIIATTPQVTGTTVGAVNDFQPVPGSVNGHLCSTTATHTAPDIGIQLDLPATTNLALRLSPVSYDSSHSLLNASCGGVPIECYDSPTNMVLPSLAAGQYYLIVDGYSTTSGTFTLNISGTIVNGESCESPLAQSGALTCGFGHTCQGPAGSRTCQPVQCNDGIDNNMDGLIDSFDQGCSSPNDNSEDSLCPGPSCPVCSNTTDDDGDSLSDFPADFGCAAAGATTEVFCAIETTPSTLITMAATTGTLAAPATDNYEQTCQTNTGNDRAYALQLPVPVSTLVIDTLGSTITNTVVSLWDASCSVQVGCDDDSAPGTDLRSVLTVANLVPGNYAIQVDGFSTSNNGAFVLNVKGTVAAGTACTAALFTSGVLVCPTGTTCTAGTCQ